MQLKLRGRCINLHVLCEFENEKLGNYMIGRKYKSLLILFA